jgi:methionyl-tRNA formyltransferase
MRVVFFGSDAIALPVLEHLRFADGAELAGVVSQPDRPAGRGRHLHANPVAAWARTHGVTLLQPEKPGAEEVAWLRAQNVELALVMAYGHILRRELLETPARGVWNFHASLLPAYRGASPVEAALVSGDAETGVSLMRLVQKMDAGPVAGVERVVMRPAETSPELRARLAQACVPLLGRHWEALVNGTIGVEPQDEARATYTRKLTKADAQLDFAASAIELERRVRALQPWPGTFAEHEGRALKIGAAAALSESVGAPPGTVVRAGAAGVDVAAGAGVLRLLALQRPGGRMLPAGEFLRGYALAPGAFFPSQPMAPLTAPQPFPRAG